MSSRRKTRSMGWIGDGWPRSRNFNSFFSVFFDSPLSLVIDYHFTPFLTHICSLFRPCFRRFGYRIGGFSLVYCFAPHLTHPSSSSSSFPCLIVLLRHPILLCRLRHRFNPLRTSFAPWSFCFGSARFDPPFLFATVPLRLTHCFFSRTFAFIWLHLVTLAIKWDLLMFFNLWSDKNSAKAVKNLYKPGKSCKKCPKKSWSWGRISSTLGFAQGGLRYFLKRTNFQDFPVFADISVIFWAIRRNAEYLWECLEKGFPDVLGITTQINLNVSWGVHSKSLLFSKIYSDFSMRAMWSSLLHWKDT